ncbi:MAG: hypothetical protein PHW87_06975 [Methanothrix sp.]|nr:hypothetical protein [Methanothrix sp.]
MRKQFIYFTSVLFILAAVLAVSAQDNMTAMNNTTMNNTTLLNNTTLNASLNETAIEAPTLPTVAANETALIESVPATSEIIPVQNETVAVQNETAPAQNVTAPTAPAQNVTAPENVTAVAEPVSTASPTASQPGITQIGSPQRAVYAIGGSEMTPSLFPINDKALPQAAYEVGLPAKTIMDLSALPFFVNKI